MKLYLAPIRGMTISFYRNLYNTYFGGFDAYYAPFIATTNPGKKSPKLFKDLMPEVNDPGVKVIPQLLGNNSQDFLSYARDIRDLGYKEINWNIGCPYPMVTKKKKGSGILPHPDLVKAFLDDVCSDGSFDLSIKMRLGLNDPSEGLALMEILNDYPLHSIILHGRIGLQKYTGHVDQKGFRDIKDICKHPLIYNGDIETLNDFKHIQCLYPDIDTFMIGRGALMNPFLAREIMGETFSVSQRFSLLKSFHQDVLNHYDHVLSGDKHKLDHMKEFWFYLSRNFSSRDKFLKQLKKCPTMEAYKSLIEDIFNLEGQ